MFASAEDAASKLRVSAGLVWLVAARACSVWSQLSKHGGSNFIQIWEDEVAVAAYHGGAVRTRISDHLAGMVDEVGDVRIDGRTCSSELALVCPVSFVSLVL